MSWDLGTAGVTEDESVDYASKDDQVEETQPEPEQAEETRPGKKKKPQRRRRRGGQASPREIIEKYNETVELSDDELKVIAVVAGVKDVDAISIVESITGGTSDTSVAERTAAIIDEITDSPITAGMTIMGLERADRNGIWKLLTALEQVDEDLKGSDIETSTKLHETLSIGGAELREQLAQAIDFIRG